jgi:hypothetical protein
MKKRYSIIFSVWQKKHVFKKLFSAFDGEAVLNLMHYNK